MEKFDNWKYNEFIQVGKDYSQESEVEVYEATHSTFRDIKQESIELLDRLKHLKDATRQ